MLIRELLEVTEGWVPSFRKQKPMTPEQKAKFDKDVTFLNKQKASGKGLGAALDALNKNKKVKEEWSPSSTPGPSEADIAYSKEKIKEVMDKLDEIQAMDKYKAKKYEATFKCTREKMKLAMFVHDKIMPRYNAVKKKLDAAYKEKDVDAMEKYLDELGTVLYGHGTDSEFNLTSALKTAKQKTLVTFKATSDYQNKLIKTLDFIKAVRDSTPDVIKRLKMSDAQKDASDKRSANMRQRWAESVQVMER